MTKEEWKTIPGAERYEVSDMGRVKNKKTGRILNQFLSTKGYLRICLSGGTAKSYSVQRLVVAAFRGTIPEKMQVDHINGKKTDNRLVNLEVVSPRKNKIRSLEIRGLKVGARKIKGRESLPWVADINLNGRSKRLGSFATEDEASAAYMGAFKITEEAFFIKIAKDKPQ